MVGGKQMVSEKDVECYIKRKLDEERYLHSRRTADTAEKLCMLYGCDTVKGRIAGLLHDVARKFSRDDIFACVARDGMPVSAIESEYPVLLHGRAGAVVAKEELGIEDEEILDAIRWHTTGKSGMSCLSAVIYIADYIEPGRTHIDAAFRKKVGELSLERLVMEVVKSSIAYCRKKGYSVAEQTFMLYHELEKRLG